jgi:hypothetical protein
MLSRKAEELLAQIDAESEQQRHPFRELHETKRRYPGQVEGRNLAERLNQLSGSGARRDPLLQSVRVLLEIKKAQFNHDIAAIDRLRKAKRGMKFAYKYLLGAAIAGSMRKLLIDVHEDGLILHPGTMEGKSALAALVLESTGRINRIKQCLRCRAWFYAKFKHQKFCPDANRKCQWNHYHSPEWRRQNRERNRRHQQEYRKRNPGRRRD